MAEFRWIQMFSLKILILQLSAEAIQHSDVAVRVGHEATLTCANVKNDQDKCDRTTWLFSGPSDTRTVTQFEDGNFHVNAKNKSDRLSVTANCSLVIKKVTAEDAGHYACRKFDKSGQPEGPESAAYLSVVNMTEHNDGDTVTLTCSVSISHRDCSYKVKWLYEDKAADKDNNNLKTSQSGCSANVTFTTSHNVYTSKNYESFSCQVINEDAQEFTFRMQLSGVKTGWWKWIVVSAGVAALLLSVVVVIAIQWKRCKGNRQQMRGNTADPENAVHYASISFTENTSKAWVGAKNGSGEDEAVTYSMLKTPSSYPSSLHTTINNPRNKRYE